MFSLSIVVPCYNEYQRVPNLLKALEDFLIDWPTPCEIIIVNDGSTDATSELIRSSRLYHNLHNIGLFNIIDQDNTGKGGALKNGVLKAKFDYILTLDADVATHPNEIKKWTARVGGSFDAQTVYLGSRRHKESIVNDKKIRVSAGLVFNLFVRIICKLKMNDTQCGFKLYPSPIAKRIFPKLKIFGWAHDVELLCRCQNEDFHIIQLPIEWVAVAGSKVSLFRDTFLMFWELVLIRKIIMSEYGKKYLP